MQNTALLKTEGLQLRLPLTVAEEYTVQSKKLSTMVAGLDSVIAWIHAEDCPGLSSKVVPGTTDFERAALARLGAVAGEYLGARADDRRWELGLRRWWSTDVKPPRSVQDEFNLAIDEQGAVALAALYESAVEAANRRVLGTFFTSPDIVEWMLQSWLGDEPAPDSVMDIGSGVGAFTFAAGQKWPGAGVWGIDVNPVALGLLACLLIDKCELRAPTDFRGPGTRLLLDDFFAWTRNWNQVPGRRLILGNPPYTRLQLLTQSDRSRLGRFTSLCGSRSSLSTWMLGCSLELLNDQDGLCLVLPTHWLQSQYADGVRRWIWDQQFRPISMTLLRDAFPEAVVDAVVLKVGSKRDTQQVLSLGRHMDEDPRQLVRSADCPTSFGHLFNDNSANKTTATVVTAGSPSHFVKLEELATIKRGIATGANTFFALSNATREEWQIPQRFLVPLLRRGRVAQDVFRQEHFEELPHELPKWLLVIGKHDEGGAPVRGYITEGLSQGLDKRLLCQRRVTWFDLSLEVTRPNVAIGPMSQGAFRIIENGMNAAITNNLYGLNWRQHVAPSTRMKVLSWLRSEQGQLELRQCGRLHSRGLRKMEPGDLRAVEIPRSLTE